MLIAQLDGRRIDAVGAERGGAFLCPQCRRTVILKRGRRVVAHFAHKPPTDCRWAAGETRAHLAAKQHVRDEFSHRGLRAEAEFVVAALPQDRRTDVMVWSPGGRLVAFELQHTSLDLGQIEARAGTYAREGIAQIWLPFIRSSVWSDAESRGPGQYHVERYSPRPFERWLHGFCGRFGMWMYDPRDQSFWRASMTGHQIYVEETSWYAEGGGEMSAGGFYRWSKRYRELTLEGPHRLAGLAVKIGQRRAGQLSGYNWPAAKIAYFVCAAFAS